MYNGKVIATPAISEIEVSHRSFPELFDHCGQVFRFWPDLNVFQGHVVYPRQRKERRVKGDIKGGPFAAFCFPCVRNFDDPSSIRIVRFLSIGTATSRLNDVTFKNSLKAWRKHGVTDICGKPLDSAFDVTKDRAALTDLSDVQRQSLKDALNNNYHV
mmetsp:Transcript_8646/g.28321  ORF Transcript_8646/g.28321 Transcript_8646/m.28321 type:complete len:158 (-) Transcript_8646:1137-1610(-)